MNMFRKSHGQDPVRYFLKGCGILSFGATAALVYMTLSGEQAPKVCKAPEVDWLFGMCRPDAEFIGIALLWWVLIWGALAMPIGSALLIRKWRDRNAGGGQ